MIKRLIFCNIAYMKFYDVELYEEVPKHGGKYVQETGDAEEKYNFHVNDDGVVRGFVETKYKDTYLGQAEPKQIRIENIDGAFKKEELIDDVCVIFCAHSERVKKTVVVGWYQNATILRHRKKRDGKQYNMYCMAEDAYLLPEDERDFVVPRATQSGIGFGQSNVWYAKEEKSQEFVAEVIRYITGKNVDSGAHVEITQQVSSQYNESGHAIRVSVNRYERNPYARRECLRIHGNKCSICSFDARKVYGAEYEGKIEVHHIVPIHTIGDDYLVNPEKDLIPVCPNCHMILHTKKADGQYPTIEELVERFK